MGITIDNILGKIERVFEGYFMQMIYDGCLHEKSKGKKETKYCVLNESKENYKKEDSLMT